jgi:hypothetical protein
MATRMKRMKRKEVQARYQQAKEIIANNPGISKRKAAQLAGINECSLRRHYAQEFGPSAIQAVVDVPESVIHATPPSETMPGHNGYLLTLGQEILSLVDTLQKLKRENMQIREEYMKFKIETANYLARLK